MTYYGAKELATSFRTVRKNTLQLAEEIGENDYSHVAAPGVRPVGQTLAHIALQPGFFDMLLGVKEHEMHHRGQLMLVQRQLGIVPHVTRAQQERFAAMQKAAAEKE